MRIMGELVVLIVSTHMTMAYGPLIIVYIVACMGRSILTQISP